MDEHDDRRVDRPLLPHREPPRSRRPPRRARSPLPLRQGPLRATILVERPMTRCLARAGLLDCAHGPAESVRSLFAYLHASPSPYHAVANAVARLEEAGFRRLDEREPWTNVGGGRYVERGGALVAWRSPADGAPAHRVPDRRRPHRLAQPPGQAPPRHRQRAAGGSSRSRSTAARSSTRGSTGTSGCPAGWSAATARSCCSCLDEPLARVPQLAIHLDRDVNERGLLLDKQLHLTPVWGLGQPAEGTFVEFVAAAAGLDPADIAAWDLMLHDLTPPSLLGVEQELIASARLDNLCSCVGRGDRARRAAGRAGADRRRLPVRPRGGRLRERHGRRRPAARVGARPPRHRPRRPRRRPLPRASPRRRASRPTWPTPSTRTTPSATSRGTARSRTADPC